jgi:hypothetical protein
MNMNDTAIKMLNIEESKYKGLHIYKELNIAEIAQGQAIPILHGKQLRINAVPLFENNIK